MGMYVFGAVVLALLLWVVLTYNRLVKLRNMVREGVERHRRAAQTPFHADPEPGGDGQGVRGSRAEPALRNRRPEVQERTGPARLRKGRDRDRAVQNAGVLMAVAEGYPDLKAGTNFLELQKELTDIEDQIQMARRYYNGTVRNLNIAIESFPSNIVAGVFGFAQAEFFALDEASDRQAPRVTMG